MNKVQLINGKGIIESFSNMCGDDNSVEIEFELENMLINTKDNIINITKYLNRLYNDKKIYYKEWVLLSHYDNAVLLKGVDGFDNIKYIKIMKVGDNK